MKNSILTYLFVFIILTSCSGLTQINVTNTRNSRVPGNSSLIYALPVTELQITVGFFRTTFIPGPYCKYAGKYLGITDEKSESSELWKIYNVSVKTISEPDPGNLYSIASVSSMADLMKRINELENAGFILMPGSMVLPDKLEVDLSIPDSTIPYTDLSVKRNIVTEKETTYKRVQHDSVYIQVPVVKEQIKSKDLQTKAEEAANFIIKLRKRKFKLLTGLSDTGIGGNNLKVALDELDKIETEYLSLFIGKTYREQITRQYRYVPQISKENDETILFRIVEDQGIFDANSPKGRPVLLNIKSLNTTENLTGFQNTDNLHGPYLFYRIPETARLKISTEDETLLEGKISVFQFGKLIGSKITR